MEKLFEKRIIPLATIDNIDDAIPIAEALAEGGLPVIEIPFRTSVAAEAVKKIRESMPDILVGAGTIFNIKQLEQAADSGAHFALASGLNDEILIRAKQLGIPYIPGVMTPTEIESALSKGCKSLKYYPAEAAGGVKMLKAIAGPYTMTGVKFIPTGGITSRNVEEYLRLNIVGAVGASWMVARDLVVEKSWSEIKRRTTEICNAASNVFS